MAEREVWRVKEVLVLVVEMGVEEEGFLVAAKKV